MASTGLKHFIGKLLLRFSNNNIASFAKRRQWESSSPSSALEDREENDPSFEYTSQRLMSLANDTANINTLAYSKLDVLRDESEDYVTTAPQQWPPSSPWSEVPNLASVRRDDLNKLLHVVWENGAKAKFAYVWLRDNCPAPHTYQLTDICKARKMVMSELDVNVEPVKVENRRHGVYVEWPGAKPAVYESKWLALRNLNDPRLRSRRRQIKLDDAPTTWGRAEILRHMRWYEFDPLVGGDDRSLHDALMELLRYGILFIDKAPAKVGQLKRLAERIGMEYATHYGHFFTVKSEGHPSNVAYTSGGLGLHTDLPYLEYPPQLQALHCIEQVRTKGGENQFSDAFHVAEQLRLCEPEAYRILSNVPLEYIDDGRDFIQFDLTYRRPVFNFNQNGQLVAVHFSNQQRSWFYDVPVEELYSVYTALKTFDNYMRMSSNMLELKLSPGQMVLFHNLRVLHGRSPYQATAESGGRHVEGCYFNWDFVKSGIRILRDRLKLEPNQVSA